MVKSEVLIKEICNQFKNNIIEYMILKDIKILEPNDILLEVLEVSLLEIFKKYKNDNYD